VAPASIHQGDDRRLEGKHGIRYLFAKRVSFLVGRMVLRRGGGLLRGRPASPQKFEGSGHDGPGRNDETRTIPPRSFLGEAAMHKEDEIHEMFGASMTATVLLGLKP
jgi:hypothetical protein